MAYPYEDQTSATEAGRIAGSGFLGTDPALIADRMRREDIRLRSECLALAGQSHFHPGRVIENAKAFYDFVVGK